MIRQILFYSLFLCFLISCSSVKNLQAQIDPIHKSAIGAEEYLLPPDHIKDEILAPRHENINLTNLDPSGRYFLNTVSSGLNQLSDMAKGYLNLGGVQIDPEANRSRWMSQSTTVGLQIIDSHSGEVIDLNTPVGARITGATWSPDGKRIAYLAHYEKETHLYMLNLDENRSERISATPLLATMSTGIEWSGDSRYLFAVAIPSDRGTEPQKRDVPANLQVRVNEPDRNRLRTFPSLLKDPFERKLAKYYITGQLTRYDTETGNSRAIGEPDLIRTLDSAPDGEHLRVSVIEAPFPYIVPISWAGQSESIWNLEGETLVELTRQAPRKGIPDSTITETFGRSQISWRPDGEGLSLVIEPEKSEEEENGDNGETSANDRNESEKPDEEYYRIVQWLPPFDDESMHVLYKTDSEIQNLSMSEDAGTLFITQRQGSREHLYAVYLDQPDTTYTIYRYDRDDFYANPGNLMHRPSALGPQVVRVDEGSVFLSGTEYDKDPEENAPRPFIDKVEIESGEMDRIFQSAEDRYEQVTASLDDSLQELILRIQSPTEIPNSWLYDRSQDSYTRLTDNTDFSPEITGAPRERFEVTRADGISFMGEIILPANYDGEEKLPALIWHYPREFNDEESLNDSYRTYNKNTFPGVFHRSPEIFVKHGYAVVRPDFPIVATEGTPNDNFIMDVVNNFTAIIDKVDQLGYIDRDRLAAGGHSYGAFGTANAMNHTSFFRAGIAGNGNFNRSLTPLGFQREQSDLWRARERYITMSPLFYAERMNGALLMYHGDQDQNVGTWPINSERLIHALNGLGKDAALYMYPYEGHGPGAEQTLLDLWTRWAAWLDYYVKYKGDLDDDTGFRAPVQ